MSEASRNKQLEKMAAELAKGVKTEHDLAELSQQLLKMTVEKALQVEMDEHLGYEKHAPEGRGSGNSRNGYSQKTLKTESGQVEIETPRDRNGSFEPQLIGKHQTRSSEINRRILALYAKGMTTRDIAEAFSEMYGVEVSHTLVSKITDAVLEQVQSWQNRPLDAIYPILYLDCIVVKIRENKRIINKSIYLALGINLEGQKELLGMWINETEGSKFWLSVLTELGNRGVKDILIACVDGLTGFPEAINAAYPKTKVQLCIVHMVRNSLKYVSWKDRKAVAKDLKEIYQSVSEDEACAALRAFADKWDEKYPMIAKSWEKHWENRYDAGFKMGLVGRLRSYRPINPIL